MRELAVWILDLPDGRAAFQRRSKDAKFSPGLIGFFGGHLDEGETHEQAAVRELAEETSLDVASLPKRFLGSVEIEDPNDPRVFHVWGTQILTADFEAYEGDGVEVLSFDEALHRDDVSDSTKQVLISLKKG